MSFDVTGKHNDGFNDFNIICFKSENSNERINNLIFRLKNDLGIENSDPSTSNLSEKN